MEKTPLHIANEAIFPGESRLVHLPLPELYDGSPMYMPIHVLRGRKPGPTLLVTATIHGDELNGAEIIRRLLKQKSLTKLRGTLIAIPIVNMYGFLYQSRYLMDRRDLNRSFPGSKAGSIAARLADTLLTDVAAHATHVIDLHTGSLQRSNLPQIRANLDLPQNKALASCFNAPVILDLLEPKGSFRQAIKTSNKPFLLYEAGEALRFDEFSIKIGVKGIMRVMRELALLPTSHKAAAPQTTVAYSSHWIRAESSGTILFKKELGAFISEGEALAHIFNPLSGRESLVSAPKSGIIIGKTSCPLAHEGEALLHVACMDRPKKVADRIAMLEEIHNTPYL